MVLLFIATMSILYAFKTNDMGKDQLFDSTGINKQRDYLISDAEFTNSNWTRKQVVSFLKSWKYNKLSRSDIDTICYAAKTNKIHPIIILTKMEQEQSMVRNMCPNAKSLYNKRHRRAMAYGLSIKKYIKGKKYYPHEGYYKQVTRGTKCLRKFFDLYKKGITHPINYGKNKAYPKNAATYSLYVYCPFYGLYDNHGVKCRGNVLFITLYKQFKERWNLLNPHSTQDNTLYTKQ